MTNNPFWKSPLMGRTHEFALHWAETGLAQKALEEQRTLTRVSHGGTLKKDDGLEIQGVIAKLIEKYILWPVYHNLSGVFSRQEEWCLVANDLAVEVSYDKKNRAITINVFGTDEAAVTDVQRLVKTMTTRKVTKGRIYIVVQGSSGPYLHEMGTAGETFIDGNYRPDVSKEYRHVVEDLNNDDPCGRIIILDGPPGTGKTHMVRALLNEVPKATFVLIPSNMMSQLGSPSFIKALLTEQKKGYPMVLVVEDADEAIAARDRANMSEISALLNFSDGIFGAMMDLRIVCTTNADVESLDAAVMRPGRLCRRIEVGKLDHVLAEAIYKRLGGTKEAQYGRGQFYTLGEIYQDARGSGGATGAPRKAAKAKLGFQPEVEDEPALTPAEEIGLRAGDLISTDDGDLVRVRLDGQFEMVKQGPMSDAVFEHTLTKLLEETAGDQEDSFDDDLIDEDPDETPEDDE